MIPPEEIARAINNRSHVERGDAYVKHVPVILSELERVKAERDAYLVNLTSVQARCTELLEEARALRAGRQSPLAPARDVTVRRNGAPKVDPVGTPGLDRNEFEAIHAFQAIMWEKLRANAHKGGWQNDGTAELFGRVQDEVQELKSSIEQFGSWSTPENARRVAREAADVANFCMMIADVCGMRAP